MGWLIFVIIASIAVTAAVLVPNIIQWFKKSPLTTPENINPPEPLEEHHVPTPPPDPQPQEVAEPTAPAPALQPPVAPSVKKVPEYLGNSNTQEIHDLSKIKPACQINRINEENKVFFDNIEEAKKAMESKGYDGCRWCLSQYHTD